MNKLIRIIAVIIFFCVFSCKVVSKDFFCFGTEEYKQKEKKNRINTDEAADLFAKYFFEKHPEKNKIKVNLNIIYDGYYIFSASTILYNHKTGEYFLNNTYWVNGQTGEIIKPNKKKLDIILSLPLKEVFDKEFTNKP